MDIVKMFKKVSCLVLLPAIVFIALPNAEAAEQNVAPAAPQKAPYVYTIKKGDTLWGISERFITDPWYWPNLWANNPYIRNPHLVYPGQEVSIYDGRVELRPNYPEVAEVPVQEVTEETEALEVLPEPQEEISITTYADLHGFISEAELQHSGTIVDTVDNRILMTKDDSVFVQMNDSQAQLGSLYDLYKLSDVVTHPHTGAKIGHKTLWVGTLELNGTHAQVYSGVITKAKQEIERGSILLLHTEPQQDIVLRRADAVHSGTIITGQQRQLSLAQGDVFYVDMGENTGLEVGNMLTIVRPRVASKYALQAKGVTLPDTLLGRAVVVKTGAATSAALILKGTEPVVRGDVVYTEIE
ncbi:MAG: LysM peptidoglycan-binding domain-containing protein [Desulfuromonadaceae bacterium]|nr:LysM peptidoglycan-binding domain-containing protein [Desulfuromonadaceae bacterium]